MDYDDQKWIRSELLKVNDKADGMEYEELSRYYSMLPYPQRDWKIVRMIDPKEGIVKWVWMEKS